VTALYLDCFSGIAGDMLVGALLDLGASFEAVQGGLAALGLDGVTVATRPVDRGAIRATKFDVRVVGEEHPQRGLREIRAILDAATLPEAVRERSLAAFTHLARAEGRVHGKAWEEVHFHEVCALDAICDVVGACLALADLGVTRVYASPLRVGSGFVECAHGRLPLPAPATLECLAGFEVRFEEGRGELVTPTGACLLAALAEPGGPPAAFVVERVGYGAGTRDPQDVPNVLRAVLGRVPGGTDAEPVLEIAANLDHLAPTALAAALEQLLAAGALDAFVTPVTMKKGRPGHLLVALAPASRATAVEDALLRHTGTLGVRRTRVDRTVLERHVESVETAWGSVRVKIGVHRGEETSVVPEYEDCRAISQRHGVPVARVAEAALRARGGGNT